MALILTFVSAILLLPGFTAGQFQFPSEIFTCGTTAALTTQCMTEADYDCISQGVADLIDALPTTCTGNSCPKADFVGCVLRLAGHDFMDYDGTSGGADGCLDFDDPDNTGLKGCMNSLFFNAAVDEASLSSTSLQSIYQSVCHSVSVADFVVIAAEAVMSHQSTTGSLDFKSNFRYGRTTKENCTGVPSLPNPEEGCRDVDRVFVTNMGLSWREAAVLMGVHTLGRAHTSNSGYDGWWSDTANSAVFNNNYYSSLLAKGWKVERSVNGNVNKNQWVRPNVDGFNNGVNPQGHKEMMLNTDMCLVYTENGQELNAVTHDCCAWADSRPNTNDFLSGLPNCGTRTTCCGDPGQFTNNGGDIDCGDERLPDGPAALAVRDFHTSEATWLNEFFPVWTKVTEQGFPNLANLQLAGTCPTLSLCVNLTGTDAPTSNPTVPSLSLLPQPSFWLGTAMLFVGAFL